MVDAPILVTGATGFVGSHVVDRLLAGGARVRVTVRATSNLRWLEGRAVERVEADLRDPCSLQKAVAGTRALLHFGGRIRGRTREEFFADNADGTGALAEAFAASAPADGSGLFLYCSSLAAGGPAPSIERRPFRHILEEDPPRPVSPYGESKLEGERRLAPLAGRTRTVIFRPPAIYGPRDESILRFFKWLSRGWLIQPRADGTRFSLIHVYDLVDATVRALENEAARGVYYLSDGQAHSWQDVGRRASEILGVRPRTLRVPLWLTMPAALISEITSRLTHTAPLISFSKICELRHDCWVCLPDKATRELGFHPRLDLTTGLEETIGWYRKRGWLPGGR